MKNHLVVFLLLLWKVFFIILEYCFVDLPNLKAITIGNSSFCSVTSLTLSSFYTMINIIKIFLVYLHLVYVNIHSIKPLTLVYRVYF